MKSHHKERLDEIMAVLDHREMSAVEIASEMMWGGIGLKGIRELPATQQLLAIGEAIAHLRLLEEKGKVEKQAARDIIRYSSRTATR